MCEVLYLQSVALTQHVDCSEQFNFILILNLEQVEKSSSVLPSLH